MRAAPHRGPGLERPSPGALESLPGRVSRGDRGAFETLYTAVAGSVLGLARRGSPASPPGVSACGA